MRIITILVSMLLSGIAWGGGVTCAPGYCLDNDGNGCHVCSSNSRGTLASPQPGLICDGSPTSMELNLISGYWATPISALRIYHDIHAGHILATDNGSNSGIMIDIVSLCADISKNRTYISDSRGYWEYRALPGTLMVSNNRCVDFNLPAPSFSTYRRAKVVPQ